MGINRVVDINGDGKIDLAGDQAQPDGSFRVAVALGHGDETFGPPIVGVSGTLEVIGDLDGDGKVDAIGHTSDETSSEMFFGDGTGSFVSGPLIPNPHWDGIADVDGNGRGEGIRYDNSGGRTILISVQPDRSLDPLRSYPAPVLTSDWQGFVDLNGDGRADCVGVAQGESEYSVVLGDPGGLQSAPEYATGTRPMDVALGDLNGDGRLDVVTANAAAGSISVLLGDGAGGFGPHADYAAGGRPVALVIGDFDGDGHLDLAVADSLRNQVVVLRGAGDGSFAATRTFGCGSGPNGIAVGDLNHDGIPDLVVVDHDSWDLAVLRGSGGGFFDGPAIQPVFDIPLKVALGDLDSDGNLDAAVIGFSRISVFRGTGGGFAPFGIYTLVGSNQPRHVAIADMNGDGKLDVLAMVRNPLSNGSLSWYPNQGNGTLGNPILRAVRGGVGFEIADLDGDGLPDVAAASDLFGAPTPPYSGGALFLRGHGDGTLDPWIGFGTHGIPNAVAVGDLNGDGTPDLVVANTTVSTVTVLRQGANGPVPALASIVSAEALQDRARLVWQGAPYLTATLYRKDVAGEWVVVALVVADASGRISYEDDDVTAGQSYSYRLGAGMGASEVFFGSVTVRVPTGAVLALSGALTNPTAGLWSVGFSLPGSGPARLDIVNLAGRIVGTRSVGQLGEGAHVLALPETRSLGPGIYFLKLTRGVETRVVKVVAIR